MRKGIKITLAASAIAIVGAAGLSSMAIAEYRGASGWGHHGGSHHSEGRGSGHHGGRHHARRHKGRAMRRLMERFDANQDSKLTQAELDGVRTRLLASHDANKDGKLSLAEFEKLWLEVKRRRMVRGFQRIDRDGDASVTVEEFLKPFAQTVERLDRNEDGVLDKQDRRSRKWRGRGHRGEGKNTGIEKRGG